MDIEVKGLRGTVMYYRMAGNFRGVLIFDIFVVDLAVTKFSHPRKLLPTVIWYYASPL